MNLSRLDMVNRHAEARKALQHQLTVVETVTKLGESWPLEAKFRVLIDGQLQDDGIHALIRPVLARELNARIVSIDADLAALGVATD